MSILIKGMEMPCACVFCELYDGDLYWCRGAKREVPYSPEDKCAEFCPLVPVPDHGDLIDRDALMRDGWLNLHKEVLRMGGYAIHELPLKNPTIPVIIPAEEGET